jgi:hypothetical protein
LRENEELCPRRPAPIDDSVESDVQKPVAIEIAGDAILGDPYPLDPADEKLIEAEPPCVSPERPIA